MSSTVITAAGVEPTDASAQSKVPLVLLWLGLGALWFICCRQLSAEWSYNEQYSYGWFVPFFALYLFWLRWEDRPRPEVEAGGLKSAEGRRGFVAALFGVLLLLVLFPVRLIEVANPDWRLLSWVHALTAVGLTLLLVWWLGGRPWLRHFAFPICFFLVSVPWLTGIEQPIIQGLMPTVASIATGALSLFGIPADVQGNLIHINGGVVGVNEACSGVRSLQTSIMIGLLFGELKRLGALKRIVLIVAAIGIAFVANCGRAFFLVWIAATEGVPRVEHWHDIAGYAIVGLVFLGCLGLTKWLEGAGQQRSAVGDQSSEPVSSFPLLRLLSGSSTSYFLLSALLWLLLVEVGVEWWYRAHEQNLVASAQWKVQWPEDALHFRDTPIDERTRSILHYDEGRGALWVGPEQSLSLTNAAAGSATSLLYFFRWEPGHNSALLANAHRPDVCLPASGWQQTHDFGVHDYAVGNGLTIPFRHFAFRNDAGGTGRPRYADAFYCVWEDRIPKGDAKKEADEGMAQAPSAWTRSERMQAVLDGRRHLGQQVMEYLLIQPEPVSQTDAEENFAAQVRHLIHPVAPQT